jgi:hypothetical protein
VMATVVAELSEAMGVAGQQSGKDVEVWTSMKTAAIIAV